MPRRDSRHFKYFSYHGPVTSTGSMRTLPGCARRSRSPAAGLPRGKALLRFEERPQAGDLGFRGIGPPALGFGPLSVGLLGGRDEPPVAVVEAVPARVEPVAVSLPASQPAVP